MLCLLLYIVKFPIGHIVTQQFATLHAERLKSIAFFYQSIGEGETDFFSIQSDTLRFFAWHEVTHMREDSYLDLGSFVHVVNAFFWQSERSLLLNVIQVFYVRDQQLFSVDDYHIVFVFPDFTDTTILTEEAFTDVINDIAMKTISA